MTEHETTERRNFDIERKMVEDAVRLAIAELPSLPSCQIEAARIAQINEALDKITRLLIGNGDPKTGIVFRLAVIEESYRKPKDMEIGDKIVMFFVDKILPNLIVTGILAFFTLEWALSQHLILVSP